MPHGNALDNSYSVGKLTPHQHTRVLRRRIATGSQTRTFSRTTHYEIEPPTVTGHKPRRQNAPAPARVLYFPGLLTPAAPSGMFIGQKERGVSELQWEGHGSTSLDTGTTHHLGYASGWAGTALAIRPGLTYHAHTPGRTPTLGTWQPSSLGLPGQVTTGQRPTPPLH